MGRFKSKFFPLLEYDQGFGIRYLGGVDEVGRGALAGPIVASCVIFDLNGLEEFEQELYYVRDSKTLNVDKRKEMAANIKKISHKYIIQEFDNNDVDELGIQHCNRELINSSLKFCEEHTIEMLLIDGTIPPNYNSDTTKYKNIIKGDGKSLAIAAASILAKDYRDAKMHSLLFPDIYDFESNVGYGSQKHIESLKMNGISEYHRKSFLNKILGKG